MIAPLLAALDLSCTPPFGSTWDALQAAAERWVAQPSDGSHNRRLAHPSLANPGTLFEPSSRPRPTSQCSRLDPSDTQVKDSDQLDQPKPPPKP